MPRLIDNDFLVYDRGGKEYLVSVGSGKVLILNCNPLIRWFRNNYDLYEAPVKKTCACPSCQPLVAATIHVSSTEIHWEWSTCVMYIVVEFFNQALLYYTQHQSFQHKVMTDVRCAILRQKSWHIKTRSTFFMNDIVHWTVCKHGGRSI